MGIEGEQKLIGHGLTSCATCDGVIPGCAGLRGLAGGDSACEEASFLDTVCEQGKNSGFIVRRIGAPRRPGGGPCLANEKIELVWNSTVTDYLTDAGEMRAVKPEEHR
jgi:thioredoxin reductase (NADPH)